MELAIIALIVLVLVVVKLGNDYTQLKRNYRDSVQEAAREQQELRAQLNNYRSSFKDATRREFKLQEQLDRLQNNA
jgi:predicted Holliday junction resolvase-like endonuclease